MIDFHDTPFTHYGFMYFTPIYVGGLGQEEPIISVRWWVPEFVFSVAESIAATYFSLRTKFNPNYKPQMKIYVSGPLPTGRAM